MSRARLRSSSDDRAGDHSPSGAVMKEYYDRYWNQDQPPPLTDPLAKTRLKLLREMLSTVSAANVLDVGSGPGDVVGALHRDGVSVVGMDVSAEAVAMASRRHKGCRFIEHSAEELPWPVQAGAFDLVIAFEVIEHLLRPRQLLLGAHEALRPGGHLAITTPYHGLLKNLALVPLGFDRHFAVEGEHIRFFSDNAIRRILADTGFTMIRVVHLGRAWPVWAGVFVWARRQ